MLPIKVYLHMILAFANSKSAQPRPSSNSLYPASHK